MLRLELSFLCFFVCVCVCVCVSVSVVDTSDSALRLTAQKFGGVRKLSRLYARY